MSYGTITSNGAATDQDAKPPNESQKPRVSYITNPEGRVDKCHIKPQPYKESQLKNAYNERMQVRYC